MKPMRCPVCGLTGLRVLRLRGRTIAEVFCESCKSLSRTRSRWAIQQAKAQGCRVPARTRAREV